MEPITVTSQAALEAAMSAAIKRHLADVLPDLVRRATEEPYLTKARLKSLTGWSDRTIEYKKSKREIPFVRRGRTILFPTEAVFRYLDDGNVPRREGQR